MEGWGGQEADPRSFTCSEPWQDLSKLADTVVKPKWREFIKVEASHGDDSYNVKHQNKPVFLSLDEHRRPRHL